MPTVMSSVASPCGKHSGASSGIPKKDSQKVKHFSLKHFPLFLSIRKTRRQLSLDSSPTRSDVTTNLYLHANVAMKERALAKVLPLGTPFRRFRANDTLLAFLESL